jgi:hypothetical protein
MRPEIGRAYTLCPPLGQRGHHIVRVLAVETAHVLVEYCNRAASPFLGGNVREWVPLALWTEPRSVLSPEYR